MSGDSMWQGHQLALGEHEGKLEMTLLGVSWCDSFLPLNEYGKKQLQDAATVQRIETVQVKELETELDRLVGHIEQPRIFLKLDTQGYDMRVIEGAGSALARIAALQSELVVKPIYQGMMSYRDSLARLEELGFELTGLFAVTRDSTDNLRVVEMDAVMCRKDS
jgi:FkbM family methyltransferase